MSRFRNWQKECAEGTKNLARNSLQIATYLSNDSRTDIFGALSYKRF
jgi:hypothetical protein